jgi:hypothetical protein
MAHFTSFVSIIENWPSLKEFGADIRIEAAYARTLKMRDALPPGYWNRVEKAAKKRRMRGINLKVLANIAEAKLEAEVMHIGDGRK